MLCGIHVRVAMFPVVCGMHVYWYITCSSVSQLTMCQFGTSCTKGVDSLCSMYTIYCVLLEDVIFVMAGLIMLIQ